MKLKLNVPMEVNLNQFTWCRRNCTGILAFRIDENKKYWIKALIFVGYKKFIEENLNKLK